MGDVWYQDTSKCECVAPPICPPPGGGNGGDPALPTVCGDIPTIVADDPGGPPPPPPPWTGGGSVGTRPYDPVDPPWPPEPPRITGPTNPPLLPVWICTGISPNRVCKKMSVAMANLNYPNRPKFGTKAQCEQVCTNDSIPVPPGSVPPGGGGGTGATGPTTGGGGCHCAYVSQAESYEYLPNQCTRYYLRFQYTCKTKSSADIAQGSAKDPYVKKLAELATDPNVTIQSKGGGTTSNLCGRGNCGGECPEFTIIWDDCPSEPTVSQPVTPGEISISEVEETGGGEGTSVAGEVIQGEVMNNNSNLPSQVVPTNALDPYSGGVYRPPTPTNSNLPTSPTPNALPREANIVGVENITTPALPTVPTVQGSKETYNSAAASEVQPFEEYLKFDPSMQIYDVERNVSVQSSRTILRKAEMRTQAFGDPGDILNERIKSTLNDMIKGQGGKSFVPFNGVTAGAFMFDSELIRDSLNQTTLDAVNFVKNQNIFSLNLDSYLMEAVKQAILKGKLNEYSPQLIKEMGQTSLTVWPKGLPQVNTVNRREAAYNLIRQTRRSLNPQVYKANGNSQQTVRRTRQIPTDIDLTLPIVARSGKVTGARFSNDDGLPVVTTSGTYSKPKQQNEFFGIVKQDGSVDKVELKSNRNIAYAFDSNQKNVIEELLSDQTTGTVFEVSSFPPSSGDIEVCSTPVTIPEILIFSSMRETIEEVPNRVPEIRRTEVTYQLAWQPGDSDATLDSVVSPYIGPRATFYIASDDPIWNYLLDSKQTTIKIKATFNSVNAPLDDKVYPRQIYTDFALAPTDEIRYNPLQGGSELVVYETGEAIKRTITLLPSPFKSVQEESYVKSVPESTDISGKQSIYGMKWAKNFSSGDYTNKLSKTSSAFSTSRSSFGTVYNTIKDIDDNYDLQDGYHGKRLPKGDLVSFFNLTQFVEMFQIPPGIRFRLFNGVYNNIKVYPALKDATEKTYLTAARLTGTDLTSQQKQTIVPRELPYFDSRYKGKLY